MKPDDRATHLLSVTRSKAKMYEFNVPQEHHIELHQNPNLLFELAVGMLGDAAAAIASNKPDDEFRKTTDESLRFSAQYFDAYIQSRLDGGVATEFGILASAAYYLAGSPGNSRVVIRTVPIESSIFSNPIAVLTYQLLGGSPVRFPESHYSSLPEIVLQNLNQYYSLALPSDAVMEAANTLRTIAYEIGDDRDVLYADLAVAICAKKIQASSRIILPQSSELDLTAWTQALTKPGFATELWPSQQRIANAGLLKGQSGVIQMPTSAGKTRATEIIIRSAFLSRRTNLAVIVAPFRALCHDIRSDLSRAFRGEDIVLDEVSDAFQIDFIFASTTAPNTILIVTPEKLLYLLRRSPTLANQIGLLIYDEGHLFDSPGRGTTYELLLTSLKLTVSASTQVILISAVIENAAAVAKWLINNSDQVVDGKGMSVTAKNIAFASWRTELGQLKYVSPLDPDSDEYFVPRIIERILLPQTAEHNARTFPYASGLEVGLYLGLRLQSGGETAVFCGRKDSAAKLCKTAVELFERGLPLPPPRSFSNPAEIDALSRLIREHLGQDSPYTQAATLGIFVHHGSVPHGIRLCVEHAMKVGLARFVICTSTLAQGVNLPIRYLIVTSVQQGQSRMLVRDFHNLMGRAGRAGMHTEGSIIFSAPEIYDKKHQPQNRWRWRVSKDLLDPSKSEPCASNITSVFLPFRWPAPSMEIVLSIDELRMLVFSESIVLQEKVDAILADSPNDIKKAFQYYVHVRALIVQSIAAFLLAHVDFEADFSDQLDELVVNTLAYSIGAEGEREELRVLFEVVADVVKERADTPEARALLRRSPLPVERALLANDWITANLSTLIESIDEGDLFERIFEFVKDKTLPADFEKMSKPDLALVVAQMWLDERSYEEIHAELRHHDLRMGGNNRKVSVDDVVEMCESALGYELAMLIATMADSMEGVDDRLSKALALLQRQIKYGLEDEASLAFFEAGFADRKVAAVLGTTFSNVKTKFDVRNVTRLFSTTVAEILDPYPEYFRSVFRELAGV